MKKIFLYLSILLCSGIVLFSSCSEDKLDESIPLNPVLTPFKTVTAEDGEAIAKATISDKDRTIIFDFKNLKSLKAVKVNLKVSKRAKLLAPIDTILTLDLTKPFEISVNNLFDDLTYTVSVNDFLGIDELWKKTGSLMDFTKDNNRSVGFSGDYLVVHDRGRKGAYNYFNVETGEEAGVLSNEGVNMDPLHMITDDAGNIVSCSFTPGLGSEMRVYWWNGVKAAPKQLFAWVSDISDKNSNIGRKLYVRGDMNKLAYLYATVSNVDMFLRWEIKDGVVTSEVPDKIAFTHPNGGWGTNGKLVPISVGKNTNYFINSNAKVRITYMNGADNTPIYNSEDHIQDVFHQWLGGGHAFDYVDMNGERYMFVIEQNGSSWMSSIFKLKKMMKDPSSIKNITNLIHTRVYNDWLKFPLDPAFGATNGNATGEVKSRVAKDGKSALVAFISTNGGVKVWRVAIE